MINGKFSFALCWNNDKYKFLVKTEWNYFTAEQSTKHYFKISKHQGYQELKSYVEDCIKHLLRDIKTDDTIEVRWLGTNTLNELKQKELCQI
jgi:uncharacterized Fe-S cluster-containing radical SAM superfamily protein